MGGLFPMEIWRQTVNFEKPSSDWLVLSGLLRFSAEKSCIVCRPFSPLQKDPMDRIRLGPILARANMRFFHVMDKQEMLKGFPCFACVDDVASAFELLD